MTIRLSDTVFVFDLDDTLYKEHDYHVSGVRAVVNKLSGLFGPEVEEIVRQLVERGEKDLWGGICQALQLPDCVKESVLWEYRLHAPVLQLQPEVRRIVSRVKLAAAGVAIITDGRVVTQLLKLHALGLEDIPAYISEAFGAPKPDPARFELLEKEYFGRQFIYIADNPRKDFITPNRMGWITFGLKGCGKNIHSQDLDQLAEVYHPHYWITDIEELEKYFS